MCQEVLHFLKQLHHEWLIFYWSGCFFYWAGKSYTWQKLMGHSYSCFICEMRHEYQISICNSRKVSLNSGELNNVISRMGTSKDISEFFFLLSKRKDFLSPANFREIYISENSTFIHFNSKLNFFKNIFGWHKSFLWGHWYPRFGLLMSPLGFKARVGSPTRAWCKHTCYMFPEIHLKIKLSNFKNVSHHNGYFIRELIHRVK